MKTMLLLIGALAIATSASAQSLTIPTGIFAAAAASDWAMTADFLSHHAACGGHACSTEANPLLQPFKNRPVPTVAAGALLDVAGVYAWNRFVGRHHPKLAVIGLYAGAAFRLYLAGRNISTMKQSAALWRATR